MSTRYTDISTAASDFVTRQRRPTVPQLIILFLSALVAGMAIIILANDKLVLIGLLLMLLVVVGGLVILQTQRNRDLVLTTEFQNALFSSALGLNNQFCLIIKRDGTIVYFDRGFQEMFSDFVRQTRRNLDLLLESGEVPRENRDKIWELISRNVPDKVIFDIRSNTGEMHKVVLSVEPIARPTGFLLLRTRQFVEQRSEIPADDSEADVKKKVRYLVPHRAASLAT